MVGEVLTMYDALYHLMNAFSQKHGFARPSKDSGSEAMRPGFGESILLAKSAIAIFECLADFSQVSMRCTKYCKLNNLAMKFITVYKTRI
jgi:hypothetical protein